VNRSPEVSNPDGRETPAAAQPQVAPEEMDPREVETEIELIRSDIDVLVGELDRRRHEVLDVRVQARKHPIGASVVGLAAALVAAGLTTWIYRRLRPETPAMRARKVGEALALIARDPDRLIDALEDRPARPASLWPALLRIGTVVAARAMTRSL
jgi:hypothetical protein